MTKTEIVNELNNVIDRGCETTENRNRLRDVINHIILNYPDEVENAED